MLSYRKEDGKLSASKGYIRRKKDGIVLKSPIYLPEWENVDDYEEVIARAQSEL